MESEAERLIEQYGIENITKLTWKEQKQLPITVDQFKVAYYIWKRFKYRPWFTNLTYKFYDRYRYDMYWMEYVLWMQKKGFLDFVPPSDLQDRGKVFIIGGEEIKGSVELFTEFMEEKAQCRVGGRREKLVWGGVELETTRQGRKFVPPKVKFRRYWKRRKTDDTKVGSNTL